MESPRVLPEAGDRVRFEFDGNLISGTVFVVDPRGGGVCFGICPSCDVRADDGTLYKHVPSTRSCLYRLSRSKLAGPFFAACWIWATNGQSMHAAKRFGAILLCEPAHKDPVLTWNSLCTQRFTFCLFRPLHPYAEFIPELFLVINLRSKRSGSRHFCTQHFRNRRKHLFTGALL